MQKNISLHFKSTYYERIKKISESSIKAAIKLLRRLEMTLLLGFDARLKNSRLIWRCPSLSLVNFISEIRPGSLN